MRLCIVNAFLAPSIVRKHDIFCSFAISVTTITVIVGILFISNFLTGRNFIGLRAHNQPMRKNHMYRVYQFNKMSTGKLPIDI